MVLIGGRVRIVLAPRRSILAFVAIGLAASGGCTSSTQAQQEAKGQPPLGPVAEVRSSADLSLPMQKYDLSIEQQNLVSRAYFLLKKQCTERFGVRSTEPLYLTGEDNLNLARRYGNVDLAVARRYGYGDPESGKSETEDRDWNPSKAELLAVRGGTDAENRGLRDSSGKSLPKGGCGAEATTKLGNWDQFTAQKLANENYDRALADSRVSAVFSKWSKCMEGRGYKYSTPIKVLESTWPEPVDAREIATATDDLECRQQFNVTGIWNATEAAYEQRAIEGNPEKFLDIEKARGRFLKAAAKALE